VRGRGVAEGGKSRVDGASIWLVNNNSGVELSGTREGGSRKEVTLRADEASRRLVDSSSSGIVSEGRSRQ
jgi:hypothetical protein